jgi:hypothetical protein
MPCAACRDSFAGFAYTFYDEDAVLYVDQHFGGLIPSGLTRDEVAALWLYTTESPFLPRAERAPVGARTARSAQCILLPVRGIRGRELHAGERGARDGDAVGGRGLLREEFALREHRSAMLNVLSQNLFSRAASSSGAAIFQGGVFQWSGVSSTSDNVSVMDRFGLGRRAAGRAPGDVMRLPARGCLCDNTAGIFFCILLSFFQKRPVHTFLAPRIAAAWECSQIAGSGLALRESL